jgi:hypothetical protein
LERQLLNPMLRRAGFRCEEQRAGSALNLIERGVQPHLSPKALDLMHRALKPLSVQRQCLASE